MASQDTYTQYIFKDGEYRLVAGSGTGGSGVDVEVVTELPETAPEGTTFYLVESSEPSPTPTTKVNKNFVYAKNSNCVKIKNSVNNLGLLVTSSRGQYGSNHRLFYPNEIWGKKNCNHITNLIIPNNIIDWEDQDIGELSLRNLAELIYSVNPNLVDEFDGNYPVSRALLYQPQEIVSNDAGYIDSGASQDHTFHYVTTFQVEVSGDEFNNITYEELATNINEGLQNLADSDKIPSPVIGDSLEPEGQDKVIQKCAKYMLKFVDNFEIKEYQVSGSERVIHYWDGNMSNCFIEVVSSTYFVIPENVAIGDTINIQFYVFMRARNFK